MKKRILYLGVILILVGLLLFTLKPQPQPAADQNTDVYFFKQAKHNRDENSQRIFSVYTLDTFYATYEIEITDEVSETTAADLVDIIENDIDIAYKYLEGVTYNKPTIVVANWQLFSPAQLIDCYTIDSMAVVSKDAVYSGDYLASVLSAAYNINQPWVAYGVAGLISESLSVDIDLKDYYSKKDNMETLDLFGCRFYKNIEGYKKQPAVNTSVALTKYIEDNYGACEIISLVNNSNALNMIEAKNNWLNSLDILEKYSSVYEGQFDDYVFVPYRNFDISISCSFAEYRIQLAEYEYLLGDSNGIQKFLYKNKMGVTELKNILGSSGQTELLDLDKKIIYEIQNAAYRQDNNYYKAGSDVINLSAYAVEYAHIHETAHFFSPYNVPEKKYYNIFACLVEGFAGYLTTQVNNDYSVVESKLNDYEDIQRYMVTLYRIKESGCDGSSIFPYLIYSDIAEQSFLDYYISHGGDLYNKDHFDRELYTDAISYAIINTWRGNVYPHDEADTFWIYSMYESFISFLVDEYSIDYIILSLDNCNEIEDVFGKSIDELFNEWVVYLYR